MRYEDEQLSCSKYEKYYCCIWTALENLQRVFQGVVVYFLFVAFCCGTYLACSLTSATARASEVAIEGFASGTSTGAGQVAGRFVLQTFLTNLGKFFASQSDDLLIPDPLPALTLWW